MLAALVCFFLKDEVLGCHDSFEEFIFARMNQFPEWYRHNLEFNLARGRVGFLTAFVISFRFYVLHSGSYTAVWLLQQAPVWFTVGLISFVTGKKTRPVYGLMFASFYAVFVQIDTNHNLMQCYPFDFMYGMSLMVLGLYLYDCWLCRQGQKRSLIWLILSVFCYYESMTVYEPFITACLIYGLISFAHVFNKRDELGRKAFLKFVTRLIPHAVTTIVFYGLLTYLKAHPVVDTVEVTAIDEYGDFSDFVNTWNTFSLSLFPLSHIDKVDVGTSFGTLLAGAFLPVFALCAAGSVFCAFFTARCDAANVSRKKVTFNLLIIALAGALYGLTFTIPHAMTYNYQLWVKELHADGYLTSSMCYFGWALMFSCLISILINVLADRRMPLFLSSAVVLAMLFFTGAEITMNINMDYRDDDAVTGQQMSYRGQAFYSFFSSDYAENYSAILVYVPGYSGIHFDIEKDDAYADFELDRDVRLTNDIDVFRDQCLYTDYSGLFRYEPSQEAGWYTGIANPADDPSEWVSNGNLVLVSTLPGSYEFSYQDPATGELITEDIDMGRMEVYVIENTLPVDTDTISIAMR